VSNRTHKVYSSVLIKGENNLDQVMFIEYGKVFKKSCSPCV
jgi:hypothetical protein